MLQCRLNEGVWTPCTSPRTINLTEDGTWPFEVRALDGVSLTIARVEETARGTVIDVCLIPETLARTNLGARAVGDLVHVEADYLAKLVARQLEWLKNR